MRKKLLALLMCATMVLGTAVTAIASPSTEDYENAEKVFTNGSKIDKENEGGSTVKTTVYVVGQGGASYGFDTKTDNSAVKLDSDGNALLYAGDATIIPEDYTVSDAKDADYANLSAALTAYAKAQGLDTTKTVSEINLDEIVYNYTDGAGLKHVIYRKTTADGVIGKATYGTDEKKDQSRELVTGKENNKDVYVGSDGYTFVTRNDKPSLFKGIKASSSVGDYVYTIEEYKNYTSGEVLAVAKALEEGTLSTDAVAAKVTVYQYGVNGNVPYLTEITNVPAATVSLVVSNDLLSRTKLKAATVDAYYISDTVATDANIGSYKVLAKIASSLDASAAYKTFDLPVNFTSTNGVVIFDKSTDESNNDGVNDTATTAAASTTAATSPKTGDVAPIAALAVVMMGACGAMVVASKKRA